MVFHSPGLAWDVCLKKTRIQLELLSDPDKLLIIEIDIRGGVSMILNEKRFSINQFI